MTPAVAVISPASSTVSRGSVLTLSGQATPSTVSTGFQTAASCSTATGTITTYNWLQTTGPSVGTITGLGTPTISFTVPANNATTNLGFSLQIVDSNQVTSNLATATVQVR